MSTSSPEAIAAYPMSDQWDIRAFANQQAFDRGRSLHLAATREALVAELNRHEWQMLRNDDHEDTGGIRCMCGEWSSAKIGLYRPHAEFYNHRIDAILAPGGPIQLASDVQAAAWDACLDQIDAFELNTEQTRSGNPYGSTTPKAGTP